MGYQKALLTEHQCLKYSIFYRVHLQPLIFCLHIICMCNLLIGDLNHYMLFLNRGWKERMDRDILPHDDSRSFGPKRMWDSFKNLLPALSTIFQHHARDFDLSSYGV